ncbi:HlyD family efflux transporter periplasmic adaptor subunit [Pleurocapsales cyanobacterium LEGE 10410]|nr:HlyD family efflux transporter periplasmic adaptor subunit [Pleurocapsales cyanobacterium LEGE 10410]
MLINLETKSLDVKREEDVLCPVNPDEFLPRIDWWITMGGLAFLAIFGAAIALVSVLEYKVTIKAPATVRPVGELRIVQAAVEGKIESIEVRENQQVERGDVVAYINDSRLQTQKTQLQGNINQTQLQLTQIASQLEATTEQIAAETSRIQGSIASTVAELSRVEREYRDKLVTTASQAKEAEAAVELAQEEMTRYRQLSDSGAITLIQLKEKEAAYKTAVARLETANAALNPSQAGIEIARQQVFQTKAEAQAMLATLNKERKQLIQQQIEVQNQLNRDRQELQQVETELKGTIVRAAASGIVHQLNLRNPEQIVSPGDMIAQIAPSDAHLEIRALVASQDIDKVKKGRKVQMRVSACPYPDYGTLSGTVTAIAPDASVPQGKPASAGGTNGSNQAESAYNVTVVPNSLSLNASSKSCQIRSGMEGRADIISKEETVLTFILRKARLLVDM